MSASVIAAFKTPAGTDFATVTRQRDLRGRVSYRLAGSIGQANDLTLDAIKAKIARNMARFRGIEQTVHTSIYDAA